MGPNTNISKQCPAYEQRDHKIIACLPVTKQSQFASLFSAGSLDRDEHPRDQQGYQEDDGDGMLVPGLAQPQAAKHGLFRRLSLGLPLNSVICVANK